MFQTIKSGWPVLVTGQTDEIPENRLETVHSEMLEQERTNVKVTRDSWTC